MKKTALKNQETYIYIDVSNIRSSCLKTLGIMIDFVKLMEYFKQKYPNLKEVRYYEGIVTGDIRKNQRFSILEREGYTICSLERKTYNSVKTEKREVRCPKCGNEWIGKFVKTQKAMKSNVDVYLASDMEWKQMEYEAVRF